SPATLITFLISPRDAAYSTNFLTLSRSEVSHAKAYASKPSVFNSLTINGVDYLESGLYNSGTRTINLPKYTGRSYLLCIEYKQNV
ncbi:MAG: hypothetical protein J6Q13_04155, partial [Clostridia bacterium]|nr:hypothetical protein [Clostridia bacterium]